MPPLSSPPANKTHTWILVLLFWILAIGIFVAGYLITNNKPQLTVLTPTELQSQCTTAGFVDKAINSPPVMGELEGALPTCPDIAPDQLTYDDGLFANLTFKYSKGWQIYTMQDNTRDITTIQLGLEPLGDCNECGGYRSPASIVIIKEKETVDGTGAAKIAELEVGPNIVLGANETKVLDIGTLTTITWVDNNPCDGVDCSTGSHNEWIYEDGETIITAAWVANTNSDEAQTQWQLLMNTITIK